MVQPSWPQRLVSASARKHQTTTIFFFLLRIIFLQNNIAKHTCSTSFPPLKLVVSIPYIRRKVQVRYFIKAHSLVVFLFLILRRSFLSYTREIEEKKCNFFHSRSGFIKALIRLICDPIELKFGEQIHDTKSYNLNGEN